MTIAIANLQKKITITPLLASRITKLMRATCARQRRVCGAVTVCFVDNKLMRKLNRAYRGRAQATDVLAFDLSDGRLRRRMASGDIIISTETARSQAKAYKTSVSYELYLYAVHGLLHLCGLDDTTSGRRAAMQRRAEQILNSTVYA